MTRTKVSSTAVFFGSFIFVSLLFAGHLYADQTPFKILIKIPTRSRPKQFFECLNRYYSHLSGTVDCHFLISCDTDDATMNCAAVIDKLKKYPNLNFYFSSGASKIEAYNRDIEKHLDFDVIVVSSDDLLPAVKNYDVIIRDRMLQYFPDTDGVLQCNDGNLTNNTHTNTYPIIGKKFYERFGYVYHPFYKSVCPDDEITDVSRLLNKQKIFSDVLLVHVHPSVPLSKKYQSQKHKWDALYQRNEQPNIQKHDIPIYRHRKSVNFGLNLETGSIIKLSILVLSNENLLYEKTLQQIRNLNLEHCVEIITAPKIGKTLEEKLSSSFNQSHGEYIWVISDQEESAADLSIIMQQLKTYPNYVQLTPTKDRINMYDIVRRDLLVDSIPDIHRAKKISDIDSCFNKVKIFSEWAKTF